MAIVRVSPDLAGHPLRGATVLVWDQSKYDFQALDSQLASVYYDYGLSNPRDQRNDPIKTNSSGQARIYTPAPNTVVLDITHPQSGRIVKRDIPVINPEIVENWQFKDADTRPQPWSLSGSATLSSGVATVTMGYSIGPTPFTSTITQSGIALEAGADYNIQMRARIASTGTRDHKLVFVISDLLGVVLDDDDFDGTVFQTLEWTATATGSGSLITFASSLVAPIAVSTRTYAIDALSIRKVD